MAIYFENNSPKRGRWAGGEFWKKVAKKMPLHYRRLFQLLRMVKFGWFWSWCAFCWIFVVEKVAMRAALIFAELFETGFHVFEAPLVPWAANFTEGSFSVVARFGCLLAGRPLHKVIYKFLIFFRPFYETSQNLSFSIKANYGAFFLSTYCVF